jgi:hypothetical protein
LQRDEVNPVVRVVDEVIEMLEEGCPAGVCTPSEGSWTPKTIALRDGSKYAGERKGQVCHGYGVHTCPDGRKYEGEWKDGKPNGHGILSFPSGQICEGEWPNVLPQIRSVHVDPVSPSPSFPPKPPQHSFIHYSFLVIHIYCTMEDLKEVEIEDELCGESIILQLPSNANIHELMTAHKVKACELGHTSTFMRPSHYVVDGSARKIGPKEEIGESVEVRVTSGPSSIPLPSESSVSSPEQYEINLDQRFADFFFDVSQKGSGMHTCILSEDKKELELKNADVTITLYRTQRVGEGMIDFVLTEKTSDPIPMVALGSKPLHKKAPEDLLKKKGGAFSLILFSFFSH